jgi:hypothetical protein
MGSYQMEFCMRNPCKKLKVASINEASEIGLGAKELQ